MDTQEEGGLRRCGWIERGEQISRMIEKRKKNVHTVPNLRKYDKVKRMKWLMKEPSQITSYQ